MELKAGEKLECLKHRFKNTKLEVSNGYESERILLQNKGRKYGMGRDRGIDNRDIFHKAESQVMNVERITEIRSAIQQLSQRRLIQAWLSMMLMGGV